MTFATLNLRRSAERFDYSTPVVKLVLRISSAWRPNACGSPAAAADVGTEFARTSRRRRRVQPPVRPLGVRIHVGGPSISNRKRPGP